MSAWHLIMSDTTINIHLGWLFFALFCPSKYEQKMCPISAENVWKRYSLIKADVSADGLIWNMDCYKWVTFLGRGFNAQQVQAPGFPLAQSHCSLSASHFFRTQQFSCPLLRVLPLSVLPQVHNLATPNHIKEWLKWLCFPSQKQLLHQL